MRESEIQAQILARFNTGSTRLFRNSVGFSTENGRPQRFGLCRGSSDLIGIHRGRFVAIEVKSATGRATREQIAFLGMVRALGGIAVLARSVDDVARALE